MIVRLSYSGNTLDYYKELQINSNFRDLFSKFSKMIDFLLVKQTMWNEPKSNTRKLTKENSSVIRRGISLK